MIICFCCLILEKIPQRQSRSLQHNHERGFVPSTYSLQLRNQWEERENEYRNGNYRINHTTPIELESCLITEPENILNHSSLHGPPAYRSLSIFPQQRRNSIDSCETLVS